RPLPAKTLPAFVIGAHVAPRSTERKSVVGWPQKTPTAAAGHGCADMSHPALVRAMLQTDIPLNVGTAAYVAPSSADLYKPLSVATRTMSRFVLVSTLTSRTETALPSSITGLQFTPPSFDFTLEPPTRI